MIDIERTRLDSMDELLRALIFLAQRDAWFQYEPTMLKNRWHIFTKKGEGLMEEIYAHVDKPRPTPDDEQKPQWQIVVSHEVTGLVGMVHNTNADSPKEAIENCFVKGKSTIVGTTTDYFKLKDLDISEDHNGFARLEEVDEDNREWSAQLDNHGQWVCSQE